MSDLEHIQEARRWLVYAREDLEVAQLILDHPTTAYRHICGLSQQAAEKALKAVFIFLQIDFPRTHDLDVLRILIPSDWSVKQALPDLAALTEWAVESRYPGDWPEASSLDANNAFTQSSHLLQTLLTDFEERGIKS
jgi:HEPN domain-containing protein